ncbi:hypothetical protein QJQ45_002259 [Haematococcus lacustris]|nr:hypothetical protein QJQ45_002259 [Haematococcus lacustris]
MLRQFPAGRVLLVDEFRTSRVSSAYSHPSEALPGQPPESFRFYDRDVSAALNIRGCSVGPSPRPTELCYWDGRPALPKPGRPGQEWVYLRDPAAHTTEEQDEQTMPPSMPKQQQDWATARGECVRPSITKPFVAMPMFDQKRDDKHWDDECLTLLCSFAPDSVMQLCTLGKKLSVKMLNEYCKAVGLCVPANTLRADLRYMVLQHLNEQAECD